ncbi:MAG: hypothetical protein HY884_00405, partial [Deltaproteobacteria bacterium]|nr:hypothetical protein [Deltaproteobacteria bacterium]
NSQLGAATAGSLYSGAVTAAVDTTVDQTLVVTGQLSSASDTMTLELTDVEVLKP